MKQITLPTVSVDVQKGPDNTRVLLIQEIDQGPMGQTPGDVYVIPMPNDFAEDLGRKLSAPSVVMP
jgi:hypothetical protein